MAFKLGGTETCSKDEFIIEVIGKKHCETQKGILSFDNEEGQDADEIVVIKENSSLNIWSAKKTFASASIVVQSEEGDIKLPIFERLYSSERCEKWHDNIIAPFVPLVQIGLNRTGVVHARDGFIYVFMGNKIWREILIKFNDDGLPAFQDTLLTKLRAEDSNANIPSEYDRPAIGLDMEAIWLPIRNGRAWGGLLADEKPKIFYSEVQLSAERINKLESDSDLLKQRTERLYLNEPNYKPYIGRLVNLDKIKPQRYRSKQGVGETSLADPVAYLHDIEGSYCSEILSLAKKEVTQVETDGPFGQAFETGLTPRITKMAGEGDILLPQYDVFARNKALSESQYRPAAKEEAPQSDDTELWQSHGVTKDIFSMTRNNGYLGLVLTDELFDLRHYIEQASLGFDYLNVLQQYISRHEHFNFANYVYHLLLSPHDANLKPFYKKYGDRVPRRPSDPSQRILLPELRKVVRDAIDEAQDSSYRLIRSKSCIAALTDLFSLNNEDYASGHILVGRFANSILYASEGMDSFVKKANRSKYTKNIFSFLQYHLNLSEPLGSMVFPPEGEIPSDAEWNYTQCLKDGPQTNEGDGRCRIYELLALATGKQLSDSPLQSLDVILAASLDQAMAENNSPLSATLSGSKRLFNDFANAVSGLVIAGQAYLIHLSFDEAINAIKGKAYTNTFAFSKVVHAELLSKVFLASGEIPDGHVLIGGEVGGRKFGIQGASPGKVTQHVTELKMGRNSESLVMANKRHMLQTSNYSPATAKGQFAPRQDYTFYTAPEQSEVARVSQSSKLHDAQWGAKMERGLLKVSPMLLFLELWNLKSSIALSKSRDSNERIVRHFFSATGAMIDVSLTMERTLALINSQNAITRGMTTNIIPTGRTWLLANTVPGSTWNNIALRMLPRVSASFALGVISGAFTVGVYISDARNDWDQGDKDAAVANIVAAVGAAGATSVLMAGAFSIGMAVPVFWAFFAIGAVAAGLAAWLDDDDIELLLENGPLGREPNKQRYEYLYQSQEAFYRFISYLITPKFSIAELSDSERAQWQQLTAFAIPSHFNKKVLVQLPFPKWFDMSSYRVDVRLTRKEQSYSHREGLYYGGTPKEVKSVEPIYRLTEQGIEIALSLPSPSIDKAGMFNSSKRIVHALQIKLQLLAKTARNKEQAQEQTWVFPAPGVGDHVGFTAKDATPDFSEEEQVFWYDQEWTG